MEVGCRVIEVGALRQGKSGPDSQVIVSLKSEHCDAIKDVFVINLYLLSHTHTHTQKRKMTSILKLTRQLKQFMEILCLFSMPQNGRLLRE